LLIKIVTFIFLAFLSVVGLIWISEARVRSECADISIGDTFDSVIKKKTFRILTELSIQEGQNVIWVYNKFIASQYCDISFGETNVVKSTELVYQ
jgi:hypothetical protein